MANKELVKKFVEVTSNLGIVRTLKESVENHLRLSESDKLDQVAKLRSEIERAKGRIVNARELMLDKEIDPTEYREIKEEYEGEIEKLEREIEKISTVDSDLREQISFAAISKSA